MKRSAAILGFTPPVLCWAIGKPCAFRDLEQPRIPDSTFKQLRILRAASVSLIEDRVQDGMVLHPEALLADTDDASIENVKGFPFDEAVDVFGGQAVVESVCGACPANVGLIQLEESEKVESCGNGEGLENPSGHWAGCFGWVSFPSPAGSDAASGLEKEQQFAFQDLMRPNFTKTELVRQRELPQPTWFCDFETAIDRAGLRTQMESAFGVANPMWYSVWSARNLSGDRIDLLAKVFELICVPESCVDFWRLKQAVFVCRTHGMPLYAELLPSGNSDGSNWRIESQCQKCGVTRAEESTHVKIPCPVCKSRIVPIPQRKSKVLGLRPYLNLAKVMGGDATEKVIAAWKQRTSGLGQ